ncbi:trans-sialidase, putative, partial [Trypanosoma cruzi marinkellei]
HFANYKFTLVATVSIDGVPEGGATIPVMGARTGSEGKNKLMELSYDSEKKWRVVCGGKTTEKHSRDWETEGERHVVILLRNDNQFSAYVDGKSVGGGAPCNLDTTDLKEISHFYIGGDGGSTGRREGVSVTVTNVLLYNRPLSSAEITAINTKNFFTSTLADPQTVDGSNSLSAVSRPKRSAEHLPAGATGEGTARDGGENVDGGTYCGSGVLPSLLLLLLGLWGFAAL